MKPSGILAALLFVVAVIGGVWFHSHGGLPLEPSLLRERIRELGWVAPFGFVAIAALRPVLALPSAVIMTAGGLAFGVVGGTALSTLGMSIGAALGFGLARALGRDVVQKRMGDRLARADSFLGRRGPRWLGAYTALPVSVLTPVHVGAGLSSMPFVGFALWVSVGLVPRAALYSFFGDSFTRGRAAVVAAGIVLAIAVVAAILVMRRMTRTAARSSTSNQNAEAAPQAEHEPEPAFANSDTARHSGADPQA